MRQPLDIYDDYPTGMKRYLRAYGWHFNKKACALAVSLMKRKDENGKKKAIEPWTKEQAEEMLKKYGVVLDDCTGYDHVYVANMCKADYYKSSVPDELHAALYVKETVDNVDAGDGAVMRCWYAKMVAAGEVIDWDEIV